MIPVCCLTIYKDVPYTFLFMNRIRTPKEKTETRIAEVMQQAAATAGEEDTFD